MTLWYLPTLYSEVFGTPISELVGAVVYPLLLGAPYTVLVLYVADRFTPVGWIGLGLHFAGVALGYLAL